MNIVVVEETKVFMQSCLFGIALAIFYDFFRVIRVVANPHKFFVGLMDVFYCVVLIVSSFSFILSFNDGKLRVFILIGEMLGALLYFFTVSPIIMKIVKWIVLQLKRLILLIYKIFFSPIIWILKKNINILRGIFKKTAIKFKKSGKKLDLHLKNNLSMLYNKKIRFNTTKMRVNLNVSKKNKKEK